jgi:hypothetical protein
LYRDLVFSFPPIEHGKNGRRVPLTKNDFTRTVSGRFDGLNRISFGGSPEQPISLEEIGEGLLRNMPAGGGILDAVSSNIFLDSVVETRRDFYTGHVYSLQNKSGWYISNGIVSHNCTCVPILTGMDAPQWDMAQDWFGNQSEERQREIMGNARYEMWKNGKPLGEFVHKAHSDTWGDSPALVPIGAM